MSITREDIINDYIAENGLVASNDAKLIDERLKIAQDIDYVLSEMLEYNTTYNQTTINAMINRPVRCATRMCIDYIVNNPSSVIDIRIVLAASTALVFGAWGLNDETRRRIQAKIWLDEFGIQGNKNTKKARGEFLAVQFEMLRREEYDVCHRERYEEALKYGVVMQKKSTFAERSPSRKSPSSRRSKSRSRTPSPWSE